MNDKNDNVMQEAKATAHDVPTVRVKSHDGEGYKIINRKDYDPKEHGDVIKGGEDQQQGIADASGRNPSGTFSTPTPSDVRYPDKDATEFENNHGAFVRKSAGQMREDKGLVDAPGGLYPKGMMRVEQVGPNEHRVMSGDREIMRGVNNRDADRFTNSMSDEEKEKWVAERGGKPSDMKAGRDRSRGTHPAPSKGEQNGVVSPTQTASPASPRPPSPKP